MPGWGRGLHEVGPVPADPWPSHLGLLSENSAQGPLAPRKSEDKKQQPQGLSKCCRPFMSSRSIFTPAPAGKLLQSQTFDGR